MRPQPLPEAGVYREPNHTAIAMKTPRYRIATSLGVIALGSLLVQPAKLAAQDNERPQGPPWARDGAARQTPPREREAAMTAPQNARFQQVVGDIDSLLRAGKFDEALRRVERLQNVAQNHPQALAQIQRAQGEAKPNPAREAKPECPSCAPNQCPPGEARPNPAARPNAAAAQAFMNRWRNFNRQGAPNAMGMAGRRGFAGPGPGNQAPLARWRNFTQPGAGTPPPMAAWRRFAGTCGPCQSPRQAWRNFQPGHRGYASMGAWQRLTGSRGGHRHHMGRGRHFNRPGFGMLPPMTGRRNFAGPGVGNQPPMMLWRNFAGSGASQQPQLMLWRNFTQPGAGKQPSMAWQGLARPGRPQTPPPAASPKATLPGESLQIPQAKIQQLRVAAMNLKAAGLHQLAQQTQAEITRLEADAKREAMERKQQAQQKNGTEPRPEAAAAMKADMDKLRHETEELRNQLRRLKAEAATKDAPPPPANPAPQERPAHHHQTQPPVESPQ